MSYPAGCTRFGLAGFAVAGVVAVGAPDAPLSGTFYVDSVGGDDAATGSSPEQAWKTLTHVNTTAFAPGSRILLRAGTVTVGSLQPRGSGEPGRPIVVDRYGEGNKPCLRAQTADGAPLPAGVVLDNQQHWEIRSLEITGSARGVFVRLQEYGVARHIHLVGLDIHDIPGGPTGDDGIFMLACRGALIERNVLRHAHQRVGRRPGERACAGIWPQRSEGTLIQFNEVSHTAVGGLTVWDSEAFDDDGSCTGTIFQYNYSHDNAGGFLLNCGGKGTVVRYNISQDDATATFTFESDAAADALVYNNTIYVRPGLDVELVRNTFGAPDNIRFWNNIFCVAGRATCAIRSNRAAGPRSRRRPPAGAQAAAGGRGLLWAHPERQTMSLLHRSPAERCKMRAVANIILAGVAAMQPVAGSAAGAAASEIHDKTLMAWVSLANVTQRAGSVVTLQEKERFDAIVFAERVPGVWMAGSDFFRRTPSEAEQAAWPKETAGPGALVQVAVVWQGRRVALYRDGRRYAAYEVAEPQTFGPDAVLLIGLRYLGQMGEIGFLEGTVGEVRLYDVALSEAEVREQGLRRVTGPQPLAWWTFEDGQAQDRVGTFPAVRVVGGARVAEGALHLTGDGYLVAARDPRLLPPAAVADEEESAVTWPIQTLFYQPRSKRTGMMWDTWLYYLDGTHYLYALARSRGQWDNIALATSPDGVHWQEQGSLLRKGRGVTWMGTGSTWHSPTAAGPGTYQMNFSEWKGPRQTIFFATSGDLVQWTRLSHDYEFVQDERWYEPNGRWDCIWTIPRPGGGLYGYWTATPKPETGGRFGFGETVDGVRWQALPPPKVEGVGEGEVGAIEPIQGRYYMMFGTGGLMVTLVADKPEGPFLAAKRNVRLLAGHTYFSRFYRAPDGLLVNHHSIARNGQVYFGTLKATAVDREGTLRLTWWPGNERLKHEPLAMALPASAGAGEGRIAMVPTALDAERGTVLEGTLTLPAGAGAPPRGLYIEGAGNGGAAILIHPGGRAELGPIQADGSGFRAEKTVDRELESGTQPTFRLLLKHSLLEFYLNEVLIECFSLAQPATGRIGRIGGDAVRLTAAWRCE